MLNMQGTVMTTNWQFEPPNVVHGCSPCSVVTVRLSSVCLSQNIRSVYLLLQSLWTVLKHTQNAGGACAVLCFLSAWLFTTAPTTSK